MTECKFLPPELLSYIYFILNSYHVEQRLIRALGSIDQMVTKIYKQHQSEMKGILEKNAQYRAKISRMSKSKKMLSAQIDELEKQNYLLTLEIKDQASIITQLKGDYE